MYLIKEINHEERTMTLEDSFFPTRTAIIHMGKSELKSYEEMNQDAKENGHIMYLDYDPLTNTIN